MDEQSQLVGDISSGLLPQRVVIVWCRVAQLGLICSYLTSLDQPVIQSTTLVVSFQSILSSFNCFIYWIFYFHPLDLFFNFTFYALLDSVSGISFHICHLHWVFDYLTFPISGVVERGLASESQGAGFDPRLPSGVEHMVVGVSQV